LKEAFAKYQVQQECKSPEHQRTVRNRVGKWVQTFGADRLLSDVTPQEVNKDLEERFYDPKDPKTKTTYNGHLTYIKSFMNWCAEPEQGYIKKNPIESMKRKAKEWHDPEYMPSKDVKSLFQTLEAHKDTAPADLADAILSFFCGMRQDEIKRVREGDNAVRISLENRNIRVIKCKGASKGIRPRSFTIPDMALVWMQSFDFMSAIKIKNNKFRKHLVKRAKEAGITLPKNAGRHTFITMHSAAYHDQNLLSSIAGNTDDVREQHYDGLTFEDEGKAYFEILPSA
jgi:site-specific recombinase XerD